MYSTLFSPSTQGSQPPFTVPRVLLSSECHIVGIIQSIAFSGWLLSFTNMHLKFIHSFIVHFSLLLINYIEVPYKGPFAHSRTSLMLPGLVLMNKAAIVICMALCGVVSSQLGKYLWGVAARLLCSALKGGAKMGVQLSLLLATNESFCCSGSLLDPCRRLVLSFFEKNFHHSNRWVVLWHFKLQFINNDIEHLFTSLSADYIFSLVKSLFWPFAHFLIRMFSYCWALRVLYFAGKTPNIYREHVLY